MEVYTYPRIGRGIGTRWDPLLSHSDSCPTDWVHLNDALGGSGQRGDPGDEAALELLRVQDSQDVTEVVVRRRALRERPEATQQVQLLAAEQRDIGDGVGTRQHGEQTEDQDLLQRVVHLPLLARILQIFEMTQENDRLVECSAIRCRAFHGSSPACESRAAMDSAL